MRAELNLMTRRLDVMSQIKFKGEIWQVTGERSFMFRNLTLNDACGGSVAVWFLTFTVRHQTVNWRRRVVLWHHERWSVIGACGIVGFDVVSDWVACRAGGDGDDGDVIVEHLSAVFFAVEIEIEIEMRCFNFVAVEEHVFVEALRHQIAIAIKSRCFLKGTKFYLIIVNGTSLCCQHLVDALQFFALILQFLLEIKQSLFQRLLFVLRKTLVSSFCMLELLYDALFVLDLHRKCVDVFFVFLQQWNPKNNNTQFESWAKDKRENILFYHSVSSSK